MNIYPSVIYVSSVFSRFVYANCACGRKLANGWVLLQQGILDNFQNLTNLSCT